MYHHGTSTPGLSGRLPDLSLSAHPATTASKATSRPRFISLHAIASKTYKYETGSSDKCFGGLGVARREREREREREMDGKKWSHISCTGMYLVNELLPILTPDWAWPLPLVTDKHLDQWQSNPEDPDWFNFPSLSPPAGKYTARLEG